MTDDCVQQPESNELNPSLGGPRTKPWAEAIKDAMGTIERQFTFGSRCRGISTGFSGLDRIASGLQEGHLIVVGGLPRMGKTSFVMQIACNIILGRTEDQAALPVAVFSFQSGIEALSSRVLCSCAGISSYTVDAGHLTLESHEMLVSAAIKLEKASLYVDETPMLDIDELVRRAETLKQKHEIRLLIIDDLRGIRLSDGKTIEQDGAGHMAGELKAAALRMKLPIMVVGHLEDDFDLGTPRLSDLSTIGGMDRYSDVVMIMTRPSRCPDDDNIDDMDLRVVRIAKNRGGLTGTFDLSFKRDISRIEDRVRKND